MMLELERGLRPRSVFCMTAAHYQDLALAEDVCRGRFTELGRTLELGTTPDWLGAELPADGEWRIAWSKFYYGLDLAHAFRRTGDERFLRTWESLVTSWIRQVPVGWDTSDVAARRVQNWIYAWDLFATAPAYRGLGPGVADELVESLAAQTLHIRDHLTPARNHRTLELYALFVFALAFPSAVPGLLDLAVAELDRNLAEEMHPDGVHVEASTHYHCIVLRSFVGARENARRFGIELPPGFDANLARACEYAAHLHRPDGTIPPFSDADDGSYLDVLELAADLVGRPRERERLVSFPFGGYHVQRSDWGRDARFLMFDCGPLGAGGHGHYDALSVEVAAGGRRLLVDPGRYTYDERPAAPDDPPNPRHWFKGTAAHNTVCVDGADQTPYWRSKPKGPVAEARFLGRLTAPSLDVLRGTVTSPAYDAVHTRRVIFVGDEYWLIEDRLQAAEAHRYDLRWHLAPEAHDAVEIEGPVVRAPGVVLVVAADGAPRVEPGWVAPEYGVKEPAPVISVPVDGADETAFLTLVMPREAPRRAPSLHVLRANGVTVVEVGGAGKGARAIDTIAWTEAGLPLVLGPVECRAACAWLREPGDGGPPVMRACHVREVRSEGGRLTVFRADEPVSWLAWAGRDDTARGTVSWG